MSLTFADHPPIVQVQAYTEALCIDTKHFILTQLGPTYRALGEEVIDLTIIPFGNSELHTETETVQCQHGPAECDANLWEQCSVELNDPPIYMEFLYCLYSDLTMGYRYELFDESYFVHCADSAQMNFDALQWCHEHVSGAHEYRQQKKYAIQTPDHDNIPYVFINGKRFHELNESMLTEVCNEYTASGGSHPACEGNDVEVVKE